MLVVLLIHLIVGLPNDVIDLIEIWLQRRGVAISSFLLHVQCPNAKIIVQMSDNVQKKYYV